MDVGFIGLGNMGRAIAANLLRAGHRVKVWNRSAGPAQQLQAQGATVCAQPQEVLQAQVLGSMLADDAAVREVFVQQRLLEAAPRGLVHVNFATVSVALAQEMTTLHGQHGVDYVAAPVFGRPELAQTGKLNVVVAGEPSVVARLAPLFAAMSERVWPAGAAPQRANVIKLAGNFMIASAIETMGEAVALAAGHGIDAREFLQILTATLFAAPAFQVYGGIIGERRYEPAGFRLRLGLKDLRLVLQAGDAAQVAMPFASIIRDNMLDGLAQGDGDRDWSVLADLAARRSGQRAAEFDKSPLSP